MKYFKSYKNELKEFNLYKFTGHQYKSFILKCGDDYKEQTHILFEIVYSYGNYEIYVNGLHIENLDNGIEYNYTSGKNIKYIMPYTTYRFSKKQFEQAIDFVKVNCNYLIDNYCCMNKNIYVD